MTVKMAFALNENNKLVHISEVENGKKCNCVCLDCGSILIASNEGFIQQHHFKHAVENECKGESVIHRAAKQMIREKKQIMLPQYIVSVSEKDSRGIAHTERKNFGGDGSVINLDSVEEEIELHGMKADIVAKKRSKQLIIEIFYRHKVDNQKLVKIIGANISAIEVKLSDLEQEDIQNLETFWSYIIDLQRIRWLHNAKAHTGYPQIKKQLAIKIQELEEKYKQEEVEEQEEEKKELVPSLNHLKEPHSKEYSESHNQPLLLSRTPLRRGPPPIDLVRLSKGTQKSSSYQGNRTFSRKKKK